ncbi:siderophore-interacting protein [Streptomyces longisporoflavus]|uniref:siderophore-interacting protein n=1 Tax=Streptomyces longisporoflavus TaxID=28044 RepID=UPI00167DFC0A|nr:siderophore-interacting protein [Streptomyces longisporoflavus]GGV41801.1 siderophore-interacting protein [Streptomyces longisporoflavus]
MGHGWEGAVLKLFRGKDFEFTVTGAEDVTEHYRRLHLTDGGMLALTGVHPTMWVRLWFDRADGRRHQRAYTLVDPDPAAGTFSLEFALHDGPASDWARKAGPGDRIEATLQGTGFDVPDPLPARLLVIGDTAAVPAVTSLLNAMPGIPATLWLETQHASDHDLDLSLDTSLHDLHRVERRDAGRGLLDEVRAALPALIEDTPDAYVWITCDTATTRALASYVRRDLSIPRRRVHALGYWRPGKS